MHILNRIKWENDQSHKYICDFNFHRNKGTYIKEDDRIIIYMDGFLYDNKDKDKSKVSIMDHILLHELASEFDIEQFPLEKGGVFKPMSMNGEVVKNPVINIANLARYARYKKDASNDVRIFYIVKGKAYIDGVDVTDILVSFSDFYNINDTDISFGIGYLFKSDDMLILDDTEAGCFIDYFEEFASHLEVEKIDKEDEIVAFHRLCEVKSEGSEVKCDVAYRNAFTVTFQKERREVSNVEVNNSMFSFRYK
jgi:hypothetical protein